MLPGQLPGVFHIRFDARVAIEIEVDIILRFTAPDVQLARQAKCRHSVYQAKINRLGRASLIVTDLIGGNREHLGRGRAVDILIVGKGLQKTLVAGQVSHDSQFDLGIVGGEKPMAIRGDKSLANAAAFCGPDRDILQIRVAR
ncbi:hypothetical protein MnTg04_01306 [bacterium MnTg04]|nr:hypothetical protein MnTg04_01306 [bacterium MnTg04]